jgi:lysophospholipase L1-like esterase
MPAPTDRSAPVRTRWRARIAALALGLAFALASVELVLRRLEPERHLPWPASLELVFTPRADVMPGIAGPSRFATNALGLRGDELPREPSHRILALGGSTTECLYLDQEESWPQRLGRELGALGPPTWIGNAGRSGHTLREHRVMLEQLLAELPRIDLVLVLPGVNDLCRYLQREGEADLQALERPGARAALLERAFSVLPRAALAERGPHERLALWQFARGLLRRRELRADAQDKDGRVYVRWRANRAAASELRAQLPELAPALAEYEHHLRALIELARARGARIAFGTQPCLWRADLPPELEALLWMGGVGEYQHAPGAPYYTAAALAQGLDAFNRKLLGVCAELGVECLELDRALERSGENYYDDVHFNERGAERVAAAWLARLAAHAPYAR